MRILPGGCCVFDSEDGEAVTQENWTSRALVSRRRGANYIAETLNELGPGTSPLIVNPTAEEVLYVVRGAGRCYIGDFAYELEPGVGAHVPQNTAYQIENPIEEKLVVVGVCCPEDDQRSLKRGERKEPDAGEAPLRTVREWERRSIPVSNRQFKLMVDKDLGCQQVTQFVGFIPPSKAPFHYHTYEEVVFILEGAGIVHVDGGSCPFGPGSSLFLPMRLRHCLENPGPGAVRLLGVFYPSGSPAAAYEE